MKTILITGANSGIGLATARLFSERGWQVVAAVRNLEKGRSLKGLANVHIVALDLSDPKLIRKTCKEVLERFDVDVLFNNAGYGMMALLERLPEHDVRALFDANFLGTMLVTQQFIPHFKDRRAGAILTTTSLAGIIAFPRDGAYGAVKRAMQSMVESLYYEMRPFGVKVCAMIPGGTNTAFKTPLNDTTGWERQAAAQRDFLLAGNKEFPDPDEAACVVWDAIHDGEDRINYPTDSVCATLYENYLKLGLERFKEQFAELLFRD